MRRSSRSNAPTAVAAEHRADEDDLETLATRLSRLDKKLDNEERKELEDAAGGKNIPEIINKILDGIDTDNQINRAKKQFETDMNCLTTTI